MIDTIAMQVNFTCNGNHKFFEEIRKGKKQYLERSTYNRGKKREHICFIGGIAPFSLFYNASCRYINIEFNPKLAIGCYPNESNVNDIEETVKVFVYNTLKIPIQDINNITLNRIDYKIDYRINCEEERQIIYDLMKITPDVLGKVVKTMFVTSITYNPKNGYVEVITYDKEMEHKLAVRYDDYISSNDVDEDFKGIMRAEVRIKNRKLNYYKYSIGSSKELLNYLSEDVKKDFCKKYLTKVWFAEPFYRIDIALEMIKNTPTLKPNMKCKLCDVLKSIRRIGYTRTRNSYGNMKRIDDIQKAIKTGLPPTYIENLRTEKLHSTDFVTFNNYIKTIRSLGINPLTFSRHYELEKIENFAKYKGEEKKANQQTKDIQ